MDAESRQISQRSSPSQNLEPENDSANQFDQPDARCIFCRRAFLLETETNEGFEAIFICRDCKLVVLDDYDTDVSTRASNRRRQQRRARSGSSESIENMFQQQFAELIGLVRHNHEAQQRANINAYRSRSRRWRRPLSDNGSDGVDPIDSLFGESESNISFSVYGGESDASVDGHSFAGREMFVRQDDDSHINSDTDIDPMHAGLDQWNSDDQDEEDGEWEEADIEEEASGFIEQDSQMQYTSPTGSSGRETRNGGWFFWRTRDDGPRQHSNLFTGREESEMPRYFGNLGDYLDARGFEELLEQLAETEGSRRGAPPAAASFVRSLPCMIISKVHEKNGSLICAVCKDPLHKGTEANQLPCSHFYHHPCILPWLSARNSCPVCRYELPTDDPDYEEGKRNMGSRRDLIEVQHQSAVSESSSDASSDSEVDESHEFSRGREVQDDDVDAEPVGDRSNRQNQGGGWMYLAAAPIVSIVGIVLVLWLGNPLADRRSNHSFEEQVPSQFQRSARSNSAHEDHVNRNRRWWSIF